MLGLTDIIVILSFTRDKSFFFLLWVTSHEYCLAEETTDWCRGKPRVPVGGTSLLLIFVLFYYAVKDVKHATDQYVRRRVVYSLAVERFLKNCAPHIISSRFLTIRDGAFSPSFHFHVLPFRGCARHMTKELHSSFIDLNRVILRSPSCSDNLKIIGDCRKCSYFNTFRCFCDNVLSITYNFKQ